jgi:hypothetical protein
VDSKGGSWRQSGGLSQPPWLFRRKANPPSPTRKTRRLPAARFSAFGHLEGGFERRLLATVRWTVATAVAFPQKSESTFPHQSPENLEISRIPGFSFSLFCPFR